MPEDTELLRLYVETGSEAAFTALVERYLPLVYSAALRQMGGDHHQAQEVAQAAFTVLARKADGLQRHPALVGWLYLTTHRLAAKACRVGRRRHLREQEAHHMHHEADSPSTATDWNELRPVVDEALSQLKDEDRTAVLLRFFENRPHAEIGARLGLSENAARMRVDRALDTLRSVLARRGITSTALALGTALSGHAVTAPPVGLAVAISTGATSVAGGGLIFLMSSSLLKTATLTVVIGAGAAGLLWQYQENRVLQSENRQLRERLAAEPRKPVRPVAPGAATPRDVSGLLAQIDALRNSPANSWQERAGHLRQLVESVPELNIPEMQLATEEDWLDAAKQPMETEEEYRQALGKLRNAVIGRFVDVARQAILRFKEKTGEPFPTDPAQLEPYLERSLGPAVWQRYEVQPASAMPMMKMGGDWVLTQKGPVDEEYDSKFVVGPYGMAATSYRGLGEQKILAPVRQAYVTANPGKSVTDPDQLLPYATTPEQRAAIAKQKKALGK